MSALPHPKTHLRIDFVIREICPDGSVPQEDLRYIKFGDDVQKSHAKDFFDRCGHAIGLMFKPEGPYVISLAAPVPNKINTIKCVRVLTNYGLKDAKDVVEAPPGTGFLLVKNYDDLKHVIRLLEETGAQVRVDAMRSEHAPPFRPGLPAIAEYVRQP